MENPVTERAKTTAEKWEEAGDAERDGTYIGGLRWALKQVEAMDNESSVIQHTQNYLLKSIREFKAGWFKVSDYDLVPISNLRTLC